MVAGPAATVARCRASFELLVIGGNGGGGTGSI